MPLSARAGGSCVAMLRGSLSNKHKILPNCHKRSCSHFGKYETGICARKRPPLMWEPFQIHISPRTVTRSSVLKTVPELLDLGKEARAFRIGIGVGNTIKLAQQFFLFFGKLDRRFDSGLDIEITQFA